MLANRSAPAATLFASLIVADIGESLAWLCGAFGFTERLRAEGEGGVIGHAQLAVGDSAVMLGMPREGYRPPRPGETSVSLHVRVDDVDAHFARARAFGARIELPPTDHPYGERQYSAFDPDGYRWTFSQTLADVDPAAWGAKTP